jgi:putative transcriptional regulator
MINNLLKGEQSVPLHQNGTSTNMVNGWLILKSVQRAAYGVVFKIGDDRPVDISHIRRVASDFTRQQKECAVTETYRYTHNDLENVHLLNGFFVEDDPDIGECAGIEAINEMNDRLRDIMIVQAPFLDGAQLRWLRSEMGLDRETLADLMKVSVKFIALAEEGARKPLPFFFDQAFRSFCCGYVGLSSYSGSWTIQSSHKEPYSVHLAIEDGRWIGHIAA